MSNVSDNAPPRKIDRETAFKIAVQRQQSGAVAESVRIYQQILAADPSYSSAWINLGVALRALGRIEAGVACLRRGVALKPGDAAALSNLGNALRAAGRLDEARDSHLAAIEIDPSAGSFLYNLGLVLRDLSDFDNAIDRFDEAEAAGYQPSELNWDRALARLLRGEMKRGFAEYEWRWQIPDAKPRDFSAPAWNGEPLNGKTLLVYAEQGFGDTIQFVRYLPMLAGHAENIVFECQEPLARLFKNSSACENVTLVVRDENALPHFDAQVALLSLAHLLETDVDSIPATVPYLAPSADTPRIVPRGSSLRIGLVWAGKPSHRNDHNRSLALPALAPLLETAGADFHSFQLSDPADTIGPLGFSALLADLRPGIRDFADSAALMNEMDLIISADTAPAHLAGALGRPVWTLVPFAPDWRWLAGRDDTPWYPTMRLFRQTSPHDWEGVVERLCVSLDQFVSEKSEKSGS